MTTLADLVRPGIRVALGDGIGGPRSVSAELSAAARAAGDVDLVVGWLPIADAELDYAAFGRVSAFMPGWGVRGATREGLVHALPVRYSTVPALLGGPLRPDLVVVPVMARDGGGYAFGTEVAWVPAAIDAGARVAGVLVTGRPQCDAGPGLDAEQVTIVGESHDPVPELTFTAPEDVHHAIAAHVARLVPAGARIQFGPGALGRAVLEAIDAPVRVDSGLLADGVVDLDARGLLVGDPVSTYLAGSARLLEWAQGRRILHRLEHTHDITRLSTGVPLVSINTALEIDDQGQVNVEGRASAPVSGPGGHPDYAAAGARSSGGLSIIALASTHRGTPTLVDALSGPVSTVGHDVDVVVTEHGSADLRGLDRAERARALRGLWDRA
ncbi:MAG: putative acetyl-CoA hydrolase/transferase [Aeromicrobium sp.]|nr:putative acetyl-CoA hydrolase/transferase [Aeromicrobium sp.]